MFAGASTREAVTVIMGVIVDLTFLFGFGNVLSLGLRLGVSGWVAPLVAPAIDLSVLALLLATRQLALSGASSAELSPARRFLMFSSLVTLALNMADPLIAGEWGKAAFDAVGPLLLIGWAHVGPGLLHALSQQRSLTSTSEPDLGRHPVVGCGQDIKAAGAIATKAALTMAEATIGSVETGETDLLARASKLDLEHWADHCRPISAESLRRELKIGAHRARSLVAEVRLAYGGRGPPA